MQGGGTAMQNQRSPTLVEFPVKYVTIKQKLLSLALIMQGFLALRQRRKQESNQQVKRKQVKYYELD